MALPVLFGGRRSVVLVSPGFLSPLLTRTRSQTAGVQSTALGGDGVTWQVFGADVPRFQGIAQRLLVEGQRTNSIRNPRCEGAVPGTPGTLPTNWTLTGLPAGITSEVVARTTVNGVDVLRVRISGTPGSSTSAPLGPESTSAVSAAPGQAWTASVFLRLHAGSLANLTVNTRVMGRDVGLTAFDTISTARTPNATLTRFATTTTMVNAGIIYASSDVLLGFTSGLAVDATLDVGWPQLEQVGGANFASTPILPPVSTPGASTRGADVLTSTTAALGLLDNGTLTALTRLIFNGGDTGFKNIFVASNVANNNWVGMGFGTTNAFSSFGQNAGAFDLPSGAAPTLGTLIRIGVTKGAVSRVAGSLDGAAVVATSGTGAGNSGYVNVRINGDNSGATGFWEIEVYRILRRSVSDAELQSLVSGL